MTLGKGIALAGIWVGMGIAVGLTVAYTGDGEYLSALIAPGWFTWVVWDDGDDD